MPTVKFSAGVNQPVSIWFYEGTATWCWTHSRKNLIPVKLQRFKSERVLTLSGTYFSRWPNSHLPWQGTARSTLHARTYGPLIPPQSRDPPGPPPLPSSRASSRHSHERQQQQSRLHSATYTRKRDAREMYGALYSRGWWATGGFSCYTRSCKKHAHGHIKYLKFPTLKKITTAPSL